MIHTIHIKGLKGGDRTHALSPITLVSGPNGSGKTSIVDAVRFCLGLPIAGFGVDGMALRDLMDGDLLSVKMEVEVHGRRVQLERSRQVMPDGTFRNNTFLVDGVKGAPNPLGRAAPSSGRELLDMSEAKLNVVMSQIGVGDSPHMLIDLIKAFGGRFGSLRPTVDALDVIGNYVESEASTRRRAARAATMAADASRRELGNERVEVGLSDQLKARAGDALARENELSAKIGEVRGELAAAQRRANSIAGKISDKGQPSPNEVVLSQAAQRLADSVNSEAEAYEAARSKAASARQALKYADDAADDSKRDLAKAMSGLTDFNQEVPPCAAADGWLAAGDPFAGEIDLCRTCHLARAHGERVANRSQAQALVEKARAAHGANEALYSRALAEFEKTNGEERATRERLADLRVKHSEAVAALAGASKISDGELHALRQEGSTIAARIKELSGQEAQLRGELAETTRERERLFSESSTARIAEERLRRARADEQAASSADAELQEIKRLEKLLAETRAKIAAHGAAKLINLANALVGGPMELVYDGGRIRVSAHGQTWTGVGLSAAQREIVSNALDFAMANIEGINFKLLTVEADPLDPRARECLVVQIDSAIRAGLLTQAIICSWSAIDIDPKSDPSWHGLTTKVGSIALHDKHRAFGKVEVPQEAALVPWALEADPFGGAPVATAAETEVVLNKPLRGAGQFVEVDDGGFQWEPPQPAPEAIRAVEGMDGPALSSILERVRDFRPDVWPQGRKIPRAIEDRRVLLVELLKAIPESEHEELVQP